jgi:hypothetical protein
MSLSRHVFIEIHFSGLELLLGKKYFSPTFILDLDHQPNFQKKVYYHHIKTATQGF